MAARLVAALAVVMGAAEAAGGVTSCVPQGAAVAAVARCQSFLVDYVECADFPGSDAPSPGWAMLLLDCKRGHWHNGTTSQCCVSLSNFWRDRPGRCRETLTFDRLGVGWAVYTKVSGLISIVEVQLLKTVLDLNPFRYDSSDDRFWDFSTINGSLTTVLFNKEDKNLKTTECEIALDNIYRLGNTSIQHFYLYSNWRNSTNLRLGHMPNLTEFTLSNTSLQQFPEDAHAMMPGLEELTLRENPDLRALPAGLSLLAGLTSLDVSGARVGGLRGWLPPLPHLRRLLLRSAGLCCLAEQRDPAAAFRGVPGLRELDISGNALPAVGAALHQLQHLRLLDASHNHLQQLPQLHLLENATLDFSYNRVNTLLHCNSLAPGNHTLLLNLRGNRVSSWEGSADMLRCVKRLNLSYNALATLSDGMLTSLDSVKEVDLRGNPVDCQGCPLLRLRTWLQETRTRVQPLASHEDAALACAAPPLLAGRPVTSAPTQPEACDQPAAGTYTLLVALLAGLAVCIALLLAAAGCYLYRFKIAYTAHLLALRRRARTVQRHELSTGADRFLFDAFVLYSGKDRPWVVGTLVPLLENGPQRYRICLYERDFQLGTATAQNISSFADSSRHTLVVLSKSFLSSKWCLWELDLADHCRMEPSPSESTILLELEPLERSLLPRHLRFLMDGPNYLEWHQPADEQYEEQAFLRLTTALGPSCSDPSRC